MPSDLTVDIDALRPCAAGLAALAGRVADGVAQSPPLAVTTPGWASTAALAELELATGRAFDALADAMRRTATRLTESADTYRAADARAADRLRSPR